MVIKGTRPLARGHGDNTGHVCPFAQLVSPSWFRELFHCDFDEHCCRVTIFDVHALGQRRQSLHDRLKRSRVGSWRRQKCARVQFLEGCLEVPRRPFAQPRHALRGAAKQVESFSARNDSHAVRNSLQHILKVGNEAAEVHSGYKLSCG